MNTRIFSTTVKNRTADKLKYLKHLTLSVISVSLMQVAYGQTIRTIAGTGAAGYSGDGGAATAAQIHGPNAIYMDASGVIYFCDADNNSVRKISTSGIITTIAGIGGTGGYGGDGGPASAAIFNDPTEVIGDAAGNLYVSDLNNNRVRKITPAGIITTIAGMGSAGYSGDGGPATIAELDHPYGLAFDSHGNLYIAEQNNHIIRKLTPSGTISTFAGIGTVGYSGDGSAANTAALSYPNDVSVDVWDNVFICDNGNHAVRKVSTSGIISTYAGTGTAGFSGDGGPATDAQFDYPAGIRLDPMGNLFICDHLNNRVRKIRPSGVVTTIAGTGTASYGGDGAAATSAQLNFPLDVAFDNTGNLYIADYLNQRIRKIDIGNTRVQFSHGAAITDTVCQNSPKVFDSMLSITDPNLSQTETWSIRTSPLHGTASVSYSTTSTGSAIIPAGLTYTPTTGYMGLDSFVVWVNDGFSLDTCTVRINVVNCHLGVNQPTGNKNELMVYPNPTNGVVVVNLISDRNEQVKVVVRDIVGKTIQEQNIITNIPTKLDLNVGPGVYVIEAVTSASRYVSKVLVQ